MRLLLVFLCALISGYAWADRSVLLAWDGVDDARVTRYELGWGVTTGVYDTFADIPAPTTEGSITLSVPGGVYVAVRACGDEAGVLCSDWSNELALIWFRAPTLLRVIE